MSKSAKSLIAPELVGAGSLVAYARGTSSISEYYIRGYDRLDLAARSMTSIVALAGCLCDGLLLSLVQYDRVI